MAKITITVRNNDMLTGIEYKIEPVEVELTDNDQVKAVATVMAQGCSATMHGLVKLLSGEAQLDQLQSKEKKEKESLILTPSSFKLKMN